MRVVRDGGDVRDLHAGVGSGLKVNDLLSGRMAAFTCVMSVMSMLSAWMPKRGSVSWMSANVQP